MKFIEPTRLFICALLVLALGGCADNSGPAALRRGLRTLEKGRAADSIPWFQRGLANATTDDQRLIAFNGLGIACHKLGQEQNAVQAFESAATINPGAVEPIYNLGIVCLQAGNDDKAIACFEKAALLDEDDTRSLEFLGIIYSRRRQWDDARRVLTEASQHTRQSPRILTALAVMELQADNVSQATELLQKALEQDAHYAPAIYNLAVVNQKLLNQREQALPLFNEYARLVPSGPQAEEVRAIIREMKKNPEPVPAIKKSEPQPESTAATNQPMPSATPAVSTAPTQQVASVQPPTYPSFEELMQVARKLEEQGRREAAFNNYLKIARAAEQADKMPIRNQAVRHAISLADGNPQATYDLGVYFLEKNRKDDAYAYFKAAADQNTNSYPASISVAKLALEKGDYDAAIVSLKKADQLKPADPEALWLLAELYDRNLCLSNSAATAYVQFTERFPGDRRQAEALNRLKILKPDLKSGAALPAGARPERPSFFQRFFKL